MTSSRCGRGNPVFKLKVPRGCPEASTGVATPQRVYGNARVGWRVIQDRFIKGACLAVTTGAGLERWRVCGNARVAWPVTPGGVFDGVLGCLAASTDVATPQRVCVIMRELVGVRSRTALKVRVWQ